jgi:hypothetical protein
LAFLKLHANVVCGDGTVINKLDFDCEFDDVAEDRAALGWSGALVGAHPINPNH